MTTLAAEQGGRSLRISPTLVVVAVTSLSLGIMAFVTYRRGAATESDQRFFIKWIAPTLDEASAICPIEYALRSRDKHDIVFLGDSTCRTGIDPVRFERLTGLAAYNLGSLRGIGPAGFLITAKAYLLHHPRPRALVLCVTPTCFEVDAGTVGGPLPERFAANYGPEVSESVPLVDRVSFFSKRGLWTVWRPNDGAAERWMPGQDVRDVPLRGLATESFRTLQQKTAEARGFFALPGVHGRSRGIGKPEATLIQAEWKEGIRRLAQTCDEAGLPLLIQFAPISADVAKARDFSPLEAWSRELESSYPRTTVARPILLVYDSQFLWDAIHVNSAGVDKFLSTAATNVRVALKR
jgi:hypothetical protein